MIDNIQKAIKNKRLILFGEIHGTKEIPTILSDFFSKFAKTESFNLCLEIPSENQDKITSFLQSGDEKILLNSPFFTAKISDGRNSIEYIELIKTIYTLNKNINIYCIDRNTEDKSIPNQNQREQILAENILKVVSNEKKTFVIVGNIHASKKKIITKDLEIITAGQILFNKLHTEILSVLFVPNKGYFFNFKKRKVSENSFSDEFKQGFDIIYKIKKITPATYVFK